MACVVQTADHLEPRQDARDAVEAAAVDLGVQMAADHHRRQVVVLAAATAEDVAHLVDRDIQTSLAAPGHELVAHLAVGVCQGKP